MTPAAAADAATDTATVAAAPADVAQANPFSDVPANSWAYDAVRQLAAEGLITGYPDNTFKGNRPMTRYEMAVLVNRAVNALQSKIAQGGGASKADLDALKRLVDAFGPELQQVRQQLAALQQQTNALKTANDANTSALNALRAQNSDMAKALATDTARIGALSTDLSHQKLGVAMWQRPGTFSQNVSIAQPIGATAVNPATVTYGSNGTATITNGTTGRAVDYTAYRLQTSGTFERIQYAARLEGAQVWSSAQTGAVATTPSYCTSVTVGAVCANQDYPGNFPMRLAYAWFGYFSPGGFFAKVGRISEDEGRNTDTVSLGGGQENGLQLGYKSKNVYAYVFPWTGGTSNYAAATEPACPAGYPGATGCRTQNINGLASVLEFYNDSSRTAIGGSYTGANALAYTGFNPYAGLCVTGAGAGPTTTPGAGTSTWNTNFLAANGYCAAGSRPLVFASGVNAGSPITGAYQTVNANLNAASAYLVQFLGPKATPDFRLTLEGIMRLGKDPFSAAGGCATPATGCGTSNWTDNKAGYIELAYASKGNFAGGPLIPGTGIKNSNVVVARFLAEGQNALGVDQGVTGTLSFPSKALWGYQFTGQTLGEFFLEHWFSNNFRAGIYYEQFGMRNNVAIPASSPTCPGCVISGLTGRAISLDSYLVF